MLIGLPRKLHNVVSEFDVTFRKCELWIVCERGPEICAAYRNILANRNDVAQLVAACRIGSLAPVSGSLVRFARVVADARREVQRFARQHEASPCMQTTVRTMASLPMSHSAIMLRLVVVHLAQ